jgi:hypothetical protein
MGDYKPKTVEHNGKLIRRVLSGRRVFWIMRVGAEPVRFGTLQDAKASADKS